MWDFDVAVISTAAPPWLTGPAYLSLWQACGLAEMGFRVAYVVPWVPPASQRRLWHGRVFDTRRAHLAWLAEEIVRNGYPAVPALFHYRGHASRILRSIVPLEDVFRAAPSARVLVLTEPEHLCWYPGTTPRCRVAAETVLGVVMTNYAFYIRRQGGAVARWAVPLVTRLHRYLIRRHTDWVVPVSPAAADITAGHRTRERQVTGVLASYARVPPVPPGSGGAYFLGRLVWDKGLPTVIEVARRMNLPVDVLGDGPDGAAIRAMASDRAAPVRFLGPSEAPWTQLVDYRVFFNPSLSEVLCTATAEALVAGRHVVLADCPANEPFKPYPNTHFFTDIDGAVAALSRAMAEDPIPPDAARRDFDWRHACRTLAELWGTAGPTIPAPGDVNRFDGSVSEHPGGSAMRTDPAGSG